MNKRYRHVPQEPRLVARQHYTLVDGHQGSTSANLCPAWGPSRAGILSRHPRKVLLASDLALTDRTSGGDLGRPESNVRSLGRQATVALSSPDRAKFISVTAWFWQGRGGAKVLPMREGRRG